LEHRGAMRNKTAVRGGGRPLTPPSYSAATESRIFQERIESVSVLKIGDIEQVQTRNKVAD